MRFRGIHVPSDEQRRLAALACKGDKAARDRLVLANLPHIRKYAVSMARRHRSTDIEDFISEGVQGLLIAIDKYDETRSNGFLTYAAWWIRANMQLRAGIDGPVVTCGTDIARRGQRIAFEYDRARGAGCDDVDAKAQVAKRFSLTKERIEDVIGAFCTRPTVVDDDRFGGEAFAIEPMIDRRRVTRDVARVIDGLFLKPRDLDILRSRLMQDDADEPDTLQKLGERWGCTREMIRQREVHLRELLRRALRRVHEREYAHAPENDVSNQRSA